MTRTCLVIVLALGTAATPPALASVPAAVTTVTPDQAREAALRAYPGAMAGPAAESVERETRDGRAVYEVEIVLNGREMDVYVDAETGAVLAAESESEEDAAGEEDGRVAAADVPGAVADALRRTHAAATDVTWDRETGGFEASFTEGTADVSVVFAADGAVRETETVVRLDDVPVAVLNALVHEYPAASVNELARIVSADGTTTYEVEIATADGGSIDVLFDTSGHIVRAEQD